MTHRQIAERIFEEWKIKHKPHVHVSQDEHAAKEDLIAAITEALNEAHRCGFSGY